MGRGGKKGRKGGGKGGGKGSSKGSSKGQKWFPSMSPGVLLTCTQINHMRKAAYEAIDMLNPISVAMRKEYDESKQGEQEQRRPESDADGEDPSAKRRKIEESCPEERPASGSLAASLAAELDDLRSSKQEERFLGWRYDQEDEPAQGIIYLRAPHYESEVAAQAATDKKEKEQSDEEDSSDEDADGGKNGRESKDTAAASSGDFLPTASSSAAASAPNTTTGPNATMVSESSGPVPPKADHAPAEVVPRPRPSERALWNLPSAVCKKAFTEETLNARFIIRMIPVDFVTTPHINNFRQMMRDKLGSYFTDEIVFGPGKKATPDSAISWTLGFEQRGNFNKISRMDVLQAVKENLPKYMEMDVTEARFTVHVESTRSWIGFSVVEDREAVWREFKLWRPEGEGGGGTAATG